MTSVETQDLTFKTTTLLPSEHLQDIEIMMSSCQLLHKDYSQILNSLINVQQARPCVLMTQMIHQIMLTS